MTSWAVIIKKGQHLNATLAGILYDRWGDKTQQPVIICDQWQQGADTARSQGHRHALFVDSGTCFTDWSQWKKLLESYPHQGLIAHLIWHPDSNPRLHQQCWFMDLDKLSMTDADFVEYPQPIRASQNLHDDYTPLWIKPGEKMIRHQMEAFGQDLIAQQLLQDSIVVNWNNQARDLKHFLYDGIEAREIYREYLALAENQLWVLNNESFVQYQSRSLIGPGSGLFWILNLLHENTKNVHVIDISATQIEFCQALWQNWDGQDYGTFAWHFITQNKLQHFELDRTDFSQMERLHMKTAKHFIPYVQQKFLQTLAQAGHSQQSFLDFWQKKRHTKQVTWQVNNLVDWVIANPRCLEDHTIWCSNVLDYKWTYINTDCETMQKFRELLP